jgi:2-amino-4-hydroxy-6-hydroxymethyldihydropteridine diphosphokinase
MQTGNCVYIGLGSNLANPVKQIQQALLVLETLSATRLLKHSSLYRSKPLGPPNQPDYINAIALLLTELPALILLDAMQIIENKQGRKRTGPKWGPRTLDLDMLLYENFQSQHPRLILPHPGLYERAFVLHPLYECTPDLVLPNGQTIEKLIQHCPTDGLQKISA